MKKNLASVLAAVLAGTMLMGMTAFAADSSTTTNTASTDIVKDASAIYTNADVAAGKTMFAVPSASTKVGTATVDGTRITVNYSEVTIPQAVTTAVSAPVKEAATTELNNYVNANLEGGQVVLTTKLRLYKAGQSINSGFGTMNATFGVGNKYDGRTAVVFQIHQDGSITKTEVVVENGKVKLPVTDLGTFSVVIK